MRNIIYAILILGIFFTSCSESDSEVLSNVNLYLEENFAKNLDSV